MNGREPDGFRVSRRAGTAAVVVACVELLQSFVPGRMPSLIDAGANPLGAVVGAMLTVVVRR